MADSAAATVKIKIEKICPNSEFNKNEKMSKLMETANKIISIDIKTKIRLVLLNIIPSRPNTNNIIAIKFNSTNIILTLTLLWFTHKLIPKLGLLKRQILWIDRLKKLD